MGRLYTVFLEWSNKGAFLGLLRKFWLIFGLNLQFGSILSRFENLV